MFQDRKILGELANLSTKLTDLTTATNKDKDDVNNRLDSFRDNLTNLSDDFVIIKSIVQNTFEQQTEILLLVRQLLDLVGANTETILNNASENDLRQAAAVAESDDEEDNAKKEVLDRVAAAISGVVPDSEGGYEPEGENTGSDDEPDGDDVEEGENDSEEEDSNEEDDSAEVEEEVEDESTPSAESDDDHPRETLYIDNYLEGIEEVIPTIFKEKTKADFSLLFTALQRADISPLSDLVESYDGGSLRISSISDILNHSDYKTTLVNVYTELYKQVKGTEPESVDFDSLPVTIHEGFGALIKGGAAIVNDSTISRNRAKDIYKVSDEVLRILLED